MDLLGVTVAIPRVFSRSAVLKRKATTFHNASKVARLRRLHFLADSGARILTFLEIQFLARTVRDTDQG